MAASVTPAALLAIFDKYKNDSGIVGVALGAKEVANRTEGNPLAVSFFVRRKMPLKGAHRKLADGRVRLPKFVEFQGTRIPSDVVTTDMDEPDERRGRSPPGTWRAGGKISNRQLTGTFGCLVRRGPTLFAMTNRHIGLDAGTILAFPSFADPESVAGVTETSVGLVDDERFMPPFDVPQSYIDVDCALVRLFPETQDVFTPDIPHYGKPAGIFRPNGSSVPAYTASLIGRSVFSYSWKSGPRSGKISHVYYVYQRSPHEVQKVACFTVKSDDAAPPGIVGDSGKLWMTQEGDKNLCIGLHSGVVADSATSSRFAMATEFSSLANFLQFDLA